MNRFATSIALTALSVTWLQSSSAQEVDAESRVKPVVVTAQKREQNVQDVGVSISTFSGAQLDALGVTDSTDLVSHIPGLQLVSPNGGSSNYFSLRGVTQNDFTDHQESPVALYVDDVYVSQSSGAAFQLFDIERVEVLRGPQGTLFGRNATGGLVHFVTKKPSETFEAYGTIGLGSFNQVRGESAIGGQVSEGFMVRASGAFEQYDGYIKNRIGPDLNNGDNWAGRLQALFTPTSDLEILLNVRSARQNVRAGVYEHASSILGPDGLGVFVGADEDPYGTCAGCDLVGYNDTDGDPWAGDYDHIGQNDLKVSGASANVKWSFGDITFHSISDYSKLEKTYDEDSDATPLPLFVFSLGSDVDQFSQEFRLDGDMGAFRWVGGLYYLDIQGDYTSGLYLELDGVALANNWLQASKSFALFGQLEYDLNQQWTLIAGARVNHDKKSIDYVSEVTDLNGSSLATILEFSGVNSNLAESEANDWAGRLQLNYTPTDDLLVYASWNRGLKGGGYNAPLEAEGLYDAQGIAQLNKMVFDAEVLTAYELGAKWTFPNGLGRLNGAVFKYDYKNYQAFDFQGLTQLVFNADAEISGAEVELFLHPTAGLDLSLGSTLLDAKALDIPMPDGSVKDRDIVLAPDLTVNAMMRYEWSVGSNMMSVQADARYVSDHYFNISNAPTTAEDGYTVTNFRAGYKFADDAAEVSIFVKNAFETEYRVIAFDVSGVGLTENYPGRPRWVGAELTYNF